MVKTILCAPLLALFSVLATPLFAHDFSDLNKAQPLRYDVVLSNTGNGLTGFLANSKTETQVGGQGVWFPPDMDLMVFPNLTGKGLDGVTRNLIKGANGVFAWMRPSALQRVPSDADRETALLDGASFRFASWGRGRSSLTVDCGQSRIVGTDREVSVSIEAPVWLSGAVTLTDSVSLEFQGDASRQYFVGYEDDTRTSFQIVLIRACVNGAATGETIASIQIGDAPIVTIQPETLRSYGIDVALRTGAPIVSCLSQYEQLDDFLAEENIPVVFRPITISLIANWSAFGNFSVCK